MTAVDLDALDAARAAATPGPWRRNCQPGVIFGEGSDRPMPIAAGYARPDAALIVAAVNALPDLIAEARRYRALRQAVEGLRPVWTRDGSRVVPYKNLHAALAAVDGGAE